MAAATIRIETWEAVQRQIASHNDQIATLNTQLAAQSTWLNNAQAHVQALMHEASKIGPLEIAVGMLEDLVKETKGKVDLAVEIMTWPSER